MLIEEGRLNIFVFKNIEGVNYKRFETKLLEHYKDKDTVRGLYIDYIHLDNISSKEVKMIKQIINSLSDSVRSLMTIIIVIISGDIPIETNIDLAKKLPMLFLYYANTVFVFNGNDNEFRILKCRELPTNTIVLLDKIFEKED